MGVRLFPIHTILCWCTKEFHNSPEWNITNVCLFRDNLTERVGIQLCLLGTGTESSSQESRSQILSAIIVYEISPKVGWYLKGYWLKEFQQYFLLLSKA